ncbi:response regulator [Halosimplex aquaticum]|uniref:Response regulator n=1 Tax=Halosimplex aquaticum TaxID=3026162 RepID=A0ABD5Y1I4_9EURY|nr:response regulator [Halosimplex aquaticum]
MCASSDSGPVYRSTSRCETRTVLVVDDSSELTALVGAYLGRLSDVSVRTETDPRAALAQLDERVDCVVCDYEMPEMDGFAVLEAVRERYPDLPFVLFTVADEHSVAERARERGARYVRKGPAAGGFDQLTETVERELDD